MALQSPLKEDLPQPQIHKLCTTMTRIPLPADDCDHIHSMHAALSSLNAATTSFDAAMDCLLATTLQHRQRVDALERRITKFRENLQRLDDMAASKKAEEGDLDDRVMMMYCPSSYTSALEGMNHELEKLRGEMDSNLKEKAATLEQMSTSNSVRSAADAAVQKALLSDVQMDNGQAVPSDAWLDHASMGLGVGRALQVTNEQRSVPLIMGDDTSKGEMEYQRILDTLIQNAIASKGEGFDRLESLEESVGGGRGGDDESVYSVVSQMSTMSVASSTRMTARQRKRQQLQSTTKGTAKSPSMQMHHVLSTHPEDSPQPSAVAGRQQSLAGSQPYLCEVFHDSYGIGSEPPKGLVDCSGYSARGTREGGTEFYPPPSHVTDMLMFNTTRNSHGKANAAALAGVASSSPRPSKPTGNTKGMGAPYESPPTVGRKKQLLNGGANKSNSTILLSHLVFKADAHAEANATPALNLPANLPHGLSEMDQAGRGVSP